MAHADPTLHARITRRAAGDPGAEAAAIIITRAANGTLADKLGPAIEDDPTQGWADIDWDRAIKISQLFSGGERRLVRLAASIHSGHPINLNDTLAGLDETNASIALDALASYLRIPR